MAIKKSSGGGRFQVSRDKPMAGSVPLTSALIGGISNRTANPSAKKSGKTGSFNKGGKAR
jgi:hypothetical protein